MNHTLRALKPHPSKALHDAIQGVVGMIDLTVAEPDFGPPDRLRKHVALLAATATSVDGYADSRGRLDLRIAIAERYGRRYGIDIDPQCVLVTFGAAEAIWLSIFCATDTGAEILMPDPCYMLYEPVTLALGRIAVRIRATQPGGVITATDLAQHCTSMTQLIIINSPANPSGNVHDRQNLGEIAAFARRRGITVMHDEVFDDFAYCEFTPLLSVGSIERTILVNSISKRYGMTGWRLGWMVAAPDFINEAVKAHTFFTLAAPAIIQDAVAPFINDEETERTVAERAVEVRARMHRFCAAMESFVPLKLPAGGFYVFPDVTAIDSVIGRADHRTPGERVAQWLLERCKVAAVPGIAFGPAGAGHVRMSVVRPEAALLEAAARCVAAVRELPG